jgi:hypothetical protein
MLKFLILTVLLSILCHKSCVGSPINTVGTTQELGWQSSLLVDPGTPRPHDEEVKKIRRTKRSIFIAPVFSTTSHLPGCAEGYRPDSMGRCLKLVQLNHTAQLDFLLKRLNAMYETRDHEDNSTPDSSSTGSLQLSKPIDMPPEPEEVTKESVEVAVVMADVLKDSYLKNSIKTDETQKSQTMGTVLNVGKNRTSLEEMKNFSDLEMESVNLHDERDLKLSSSNATKYKIINRSKSSSVPKANLSVMDEKQLSSTTPLSVLLWEKNRQSLTEPIKATDSAVKILEEVGNMSTEDGRSENASRRNGSPDENAREEATTETVTIVTEPFAVNAAGGERKRNRNFQLKRMLLLLGIIGLIKENLV